eukprot:352864-Chlamydomonas_euryale.AAC.2
MAACQVGTFMCARHLIAISFSGKGDQDKHENEHRSISIRMKNGAISRGGCGRKRLEREHETVRPL